MPGSTLRILRPFGIALAGLLLVAMFAVIRFPYERFAPRLERLIAGALDGASVSIREIGPAFGLSGPVLEARSVVISGAIPREIRLQPLRLRPALSLRVFRGELALYVVHGCLHLCGFDDHGERPRRRMRRAERAVLAELGLGLG